MRRSTLRPADLLHVGVSGLTARPLRAVLSAAGIAIGIAAMVAVVGISASSQAELDARLDDLGTNLLTVTPGQTLFGEPATLHPRSVPMIGRIDGVEHVSSVSTIGDVSARRTPLVSELETGGISVSGARLDLLAVLEGRMAVGAWLNEATARYPAIVLGTTAAARLGVDSVSGDDGEGTAVWVGERWFVVVGILEPVPLAPEIDSSALVGVPAARRYLDGDGRPTTIYERSPDAMVSGIRDLLPATANPEKPEEVSVSRPSDALAARDAAADAFQGLFVGLGAVALLVGGIGVANTMVISVLERRPEIGLRRALGATRGHVRLQFLGESVLLSVLGGAAGAVLGAVVTAGYAHSRGWPGAVPAWVLTGALVATATIGTVAGLYPASRAARLDPSRVLSSG